MKIHYDNHQNEWNDIISNESRFLHASSWFNKKTLDYWRHARIRNTINPLVKNGVNNKWLTIGDGRFGTDANYLIANGINDVMATDISDTLLKIGCEKGFIKKYSAQNAEALTFSDEEFDYVYCKESYHHFPRPYIAIYEMLRVAKYAIALTEPVQQKQTLLIQMLKNIIGKEITSHYFEPVGNYVYTISIPEIEKLMLGIGLRYYAYLSINDHYQCGIENIPIYGGTFKDYLKRFALKGIIKIKDLFSQIGLINSNLVTIIIFKQMPSQVQILDLKTGGFKCVLLPKNPYSNY
jgi:ubiquinone/menaquinone biosynthesis C-methylase UbiE